MQEFHPVRRGLAQISITLNEFDLYWNAAIRKNNAKKMLKCVDPVLECCREFQQNCNPEIFHESKVLAPFIKDLEECQVMPKESKAEQEAFISKTDGCLTRLKSETEKALDPYPSTPPCCPPLAPRFSHVDQRRDLGA